MSDKDGQAKAVISFRVDEEVKEDFKKNVPNMTKALREVVKSYADHPEMSLEERIETTRHSILRMHKTRLESEVEQLQDHLNEINEVIGEVEEEPEIIHSVDLSGLYDND